MTDKQRAALKRLIEEDTRATAGNSQAAHAALVRSGIIDKDGKLTPEYQPGSTADSTIN